MTLLGHAERVFTWFLLDAQLDRSIRRFNRAREITEYEVIPQEAQAAYIAALNARTIAEKRQALRILNAHAWDLSAYPYI